MDDGRAGSRPRRLFVIFNPTAGGGSARKLWPRIAVALQEAMGAIELTVAETNGPGEAAALAATAAGQEFDLMAVCGGDGTLHEAVNGLARVGAAAGPMAVLVLPAGTGNDFYRSLGLPMDPLWVAARMGRPNCVAVDLGQVGDRYFVNVAGVGFDAEVAAEVNRGSKAGGGSLPYVWAILKKLATYKNAPLTIRLDEDVLQRRALLVAIGVASYYGGGMRILPGADLQDGHLDICVGGDLSKLGTLGLLARVFSGQHVHHPQVEMARARRVRVEGPTHLHVHADGEVIGRLPMDFQCIPRGLLLALPEEHRLPGSGT